jgi:hypothetical protein
MKIVDSALSLYIWVGLTALMIFLYRIARFYQTTSGRRSYYQLFLIPIGLLLAGGLRYASLNIIVGDALGDLLMIGGGLSLIGLGYYMLKLMTGGRSS